MKQISEFDVSVVIPVHNNEAYLMDCLNSVLHQSIIDRIEIICVDDGSTDGSLEIINSLRQECDNIVVLEQEKRGAGIARNHGLEVAKGQYIMFMDGDDYYADRFSVEKLYDAVSTNMVDVCFGNMLRLYKGRVVTKFEHSRRFSNFAYEGIIRTDAFAYPFIHVLCIYKKDFLINNKIVYPDKKRGQDAVFCSEVLKCTSEIYHINSPIYVHRITESKRVLQYEKAVDYVDCWKMIINNCDNVSLKKAYSKLASIELRIFSSIGWYSQVEKNDDWSKVDKINRILSENGAKKLLEQSQWKKRGFLYWAERVYIYMYRAIRLLQKEFNYIFFSIPVSE